MPCNLICCSHASGIGTALVSGAPCQRLLREACVRSPLSDHLTHESTQAIVSSSPAALLYADQGLRQHDETLLMHVQGEEPPDNVLLVDAVPHDWLFPRCQAVIHHGGAGTTAAGLLASCPTTVVPFFGDQSFW